MRGLFDIISIGSNTMDVFVKTDLKTKSFRDSSKAPPEKFIAYPLGSKILISHIDFQVGGGGTNTAVAFSKLGLKTGYLGKIGHDENGVKVYRSLKKNNVRFIGALGSSTGFSVVLDSIASDRTILTSKGCNNDLKWSEVSKKHLKTRWFYISAMMGDSLETIKKLCREFSKEDVGIAFNPSSYLAKQGFRKLKQILSVTDILILNREEAGLLCANNDMSIQGTLIELYEHIRGIVVITDGSKGVWAYDGSFVYHAKPRHNIRVVETTGAGDAFGTGFVTGSLWKKPIEECIKLGLIQAESVIQEYGAKNGLLSEKQMRSKLARDRRKVSKHVAVQGGVV